MRVSDIMSKALVVDDKISVKEAAKIMSDKNSGCLIVMKNEKIAGIVSEKDIINNISKLGERVSQIMTEKVVTIDQKADIDEAAELMAEKKIKKLPVISKGELVGIVTATDIIAHADALNEDFFIE